MNRLVRWCGLSAMVMTAATAWGDCPPCGQMQCLNQTGFPAQRDAKKKRLTDAGFARSWAALVDNDGACPLCLQNGPDWFTLLTVKNDGSTSAVTWNSQQQQYAIADVKAGKAREVYAVYSRKRCACCQEKPAEQQPDWDGAIGLSKSLAIKLAP